MRRGGSDHQTRWQRQRNRINSFIHGHKSVFICGYVSNAESLPSARVVVRDNKMTLGYIADLSSRNPQRGYIWSQFKEWGDTDRHGIYFLYAGDDCEAYGNEIYQHWDGIQDSAGGGTREKYATYARRLKVHHNTIRECCDDALEPTGGEIDAEWHDNICQDNLIGLRLKDIKNGSRWLCRKLIKPITC